MKFEDTENRNSRQPKPPSRNHLQRWLEICVKPEIFDVNMCCTSGYNRPMREKHKRPDKVEKMNEERQE
jgi:hypothetical protein